MDQALTNEIFVERSGAGRPLVLLHGLGGPAMWQSLVPLLNPHCAVLSVHLPGFGRTPPTIRPLSTAELADRIVAAIPGPCVFVGTSYGGQLAIEIASRGHAAAALVLIASTGLAPKHRIADSDVGWTIASRMIRSVALRSGTVMERSSRRAFYDLGKRPRDLVERFRADMTVPGRRESWAGVLRNVLRRDPEFGKKLDRLLLPTLIIAGSEDRIVPPEAAGELHAHIRGSRVQLVERCGHSLPLEQPERLRDLILEHAGI